MPSLNLPTPNKTPGDGAPADDANLIIEAINTLNSAVDNIPAGPQGPQGEPGTPGANGVAATITVSSTVTTNPGADAQVIEGGTEQNRTLAFYIPRGQTGPQGDTGPQGAIGPTGPEGPAGVGVPAGGSSGFILAKASGDNYDTEWVPAGEAPPVSSVDGRTGVVTLNDLYDAAGAAAAAQAAAEATAAAYADGLAVNYDPAGSAASAQAAAESYADGLAANYDPAGSAATVAGNLTTHEGDTTSVHGISDTANLVYTNDSRLSDARTPTAHATTHGAAGSDPVTIANTQVTGLGTSSTVNVPAAGNAASNEVVLGSDTRLTDQRTPLDGSVTTAKIVDANVTNDKLQNSAITINGSPVSLGGSVTIDALPSQAGNNGEYLTTDGSTASWAPIVTDPTPSLFLLGGM